MTKRRQASNQGCIIFLLFLLVPLSIGIAFTSIWAALFFIALYSFIGWGLYRFYKAQKVANNIRDQTFINSGIKEIDVMTGIQFEHYLKVLFRNLGYTVNITKASGDFGADLVISKYDKKIVVQAKRYFTSIGIKAIQEVYSSKQYYGADEAWVVTNSFFTEAAKKLANVNEVVLIDRQRLIELILSTEAELESQQTTTSKQGKENFPDQIFRSK